VAAALDEIDASLVRMRRGDVVREQVVEARSVLRSTTPSAIDGSNLDRAMERVQVALATIDAAIEHRYLRPDDDD
jgi:broad specificity phosphatase PhoE